LTLPLSTSVEVNRTSSEVFRYVTDPSRFAEWQEGVVGGHMVTDGEPKVGDHCVTTRRIGFANRDVTSEITQLNSPSTWTLRGIDGPIRAKVHVMVEPLDGDRRSRVTIEIDFTGHGIGRVIVPLVVLPQARKEMPANMQRLKQRMEEDNRS
jgi:Polyketide cyclase / dehydrase and lipid transport